MLKVLFAGTPDVAVPSLKLLAQDTEHFEVVAVLTRPDAPTGRGRKLVANPVKQAALELGLPVIESDPSEETFVSELAATGAQAAAVVAYGKILKQDVLDALPMGWYNLHFSLLPQWRGAAPVQRSIWAGEKVTGATVFRIVRAMDAGPILAQSTVEIGAHETAGELHIVLVTSLFERRAAGLYHNTAVVFDTDGSIAGKYRKMHIPDDPAYYEKFYFTPGDLGFTPIKTSIGTLGVLVCWDQWYPEAARLMALQGADMLIYPTAIGWESSDTPQEQKRQQDAWIISQRGHAVANGLPVVAVNRVGHEPDPSGQTNGIQFWGHSFVCGPQGEILAAAPDDSEWCEVVEIDLTRSENVRRWWPFLRDRRIDSYNDILRRFID